MAASDLTTVSFIFKRLYSARQVGDLAMRDHPFMAMLAKEGGFGGEAFYYPIRYGNPQGISNVFATAQANASSSKGKQLAATRKRKYAVITLDGEAMAASRDNPGAFQRMVETETDGVLEEMADHLAFEITRDGYNARGRRSSLSGNIVTLTTADDARNFKVGMTVIADDTATGASPRSGTTTVASVDEDAGTVTLTSAASITSFADNDYLFAQGEENAGIEGLAVHFPLTAPSPGESFRGIDRTSHTRLLAGARIDDTGTSIEENAGLLAVKISQSGKRADSLWLNPVNFWACVRRLNAKVEYDDGGGTANYGFQFFMIHTPAGSLKVYSDPDFPTNRGYVLRMSTLYVKHLEGFPHIIQDDGRPNLRQSDADGLEARARSWSNIICTEPGANGVFSI